MRLFQCPSRLLLLSALAGPAWAVAQAPIALDVGRSAPERTLAADDVHAYTAELEAGQFARFVVEQQGVDVVVTVVGPGGDELLEMDSPNGDTGPEIAGVAAPTTGVYRLLVRPYDAWAGEGTYAARLDDVLSPEAYAARLAAEAAARDSVVAWLADRAFPLRHVAAGNGFEDLAPLRDVLRDVRVVGLGEATHGTREFFQFKHRMLEFLVRELGVRMFAIEASLAASEEVIDPFVQGGPGEVGPVLSSQRFWTWDTEEVRDLLLWMRAYNLSVPTGERVHFVGIDVQYNDEGRRALLDVLRRGAPDRAAEAEALFATEFDSLSVRSFYSTDSTETATILARLGELKGRYAALAAAVEADAARLAAATSAADADRAVRYARTLAQYADAYSQDPRTGGMVALRDRYMAENLQRALDAAPPGTRAALWAHNGHVATATVPGVMLGTYLRRAYGDAYYALGFGFGQGAFQAIDGNGWDNGEGDPRRRLTEFRLGAAPVETADGLLDLAAERAGAGAVVLNLRGADGPPTVRHWLAEPHGMVSIGSTFWGPTPALYFPIVLPETYDGIAFFRTTTRARPMPGVIPPP